MPNVGEESAGPSAHVVAAALTDWRRFHRFGHCPVSHWFGEGEGKRSFSLHGCRGMIGMSSRATTKTVERSVDTKTSSVREAPLGTKRGATRLQIRKAMLFKPRPTPRKLKLFYVVQFGNNSGLIRDLLKHRRIWFPGTARYTAGRGPASRD